MPDEASAEPAAQPSPAEPVAEPAVADRRPRITRKAWVIGGAVALVCLAIVVAGIVLALGDDDAGPGGADDRTDAAPIGDREQAELQLVSGAATVTVRTESMRDTLYRVTTPAGGDAVPDVVDRGDRIEVHLTPTGEAGPSSVEILLSTEVRWTTLRFGGGADELRVDLTGGTVAELDFAAGASRIDATLPVPDGTVPIRVGAGAGRLAIAAPPDVPVQVALRRGAGQVTIDGESRSGIASGTTFTPDGWEQAEDRYDLQSAGLGELVVTRTGS